jgi:hypothetical protein
MSGKSHPEALTLGNKLVLKLLPKGDVIMLYSLDDRKLSDELAPKII